MTGAGMCDRCHRVADPLLPSAKGRICVVCFNLLYNKDRRRKEPIESTSEDIKSEIERY